MATSGLCHPAQDSVPELPYENRDLRSSGEEQSECKAAAHHRRGLPAMSANMSKFTPKVWGSLDCFMGSLFSALIETGLEPRSEILSIAMVAYKRLPYQ